MYHKRTSNLSRPLTVGPRNLLIQSQLIQSLLPVLLPYFMMVWWRRRAGSLKLLYGGRILQFHRPLQFLSCWWSTLYCGLPSGPSTLHQPGASFLVDFPCSLSRQYSPRQLSSPPDASVGYPVAQALWRSLAEFWKLQKLRGVICRNVTGVDGFFQSVKIRSMTSSEGK